MVSVCTPTRSKAPLTIIGIRSPMAPGMRLPWWKEIWKKCRKPGKRGPGQPASPSGTEDAVGRADHPVLRLQRPPSDADAWEGGWREQNPVDRAWGQQEQGSFRIVSRAPGAAVPNSGSAAPQQPRRLWRPPDIVITAGATDGRRVAVIRLPHLCGVSGFTARVQSDSEAQLNRRVTLKPECRKQFAC